MEAKIEVPKSLSDALMDFNEGVIKYNEAVMRSRVKLVQMNYLGVPEDPNNPAVSHTTKGKKSKNVGPVKKDDKPNNDGSDADPDNIKMGAGFGDDINALYKKGKDGNFIKTSADVNSGNSNGGGGGTSKSVVMHLTVQQHNSFKDGGSHHELDKAKEDLVSLVVDAGSDAAETIAQ